MRTVFKKAAMLCGIAITLNLFVFGCSNDSSNNDDNTPSSPSVNNSSSSETGSGVSFESFAPRSILVENMTNKRLVAFKNSVTPNNLISGIPEFATNHGLKKEGLFTSTNEFVLVLVTEEEYINNKSNLPAAAIFAEIYAFYNHEADNNNVFKISSKAGGNGRIILQNPTFWNIEIRKDGPTGEVLGYIAPYIQNTALRLEIPDDYDLFPVFKKYVPSEKEIYDIVPKYNEGHELLVGKPYMQSFALGEAPQTWNFNELASQLNITLTSGGFYIRIQNDAGTAIRFARGTEELPTSTGVKGIQQTYTNLYSIKIARNPDGTYPDKQVASGYFIGTTQLMLPLPEREYKIDYIYSVRVTGANAANLVIGEIEESDSPIDLGAKLGL